MVPPRLSRVRSIVVAFAVFLLVGCVSNPAVPRPQPVGHVLEGALAGQQRAYLTVRDAASRVQVETAELPGRLYRVTTPADSGLSPRVSGPPDRVRLDLRRTGDQGPDTVVITLNRNVRWDIRLPAGAGEQHLDLSGGKLRRLDLGAAGLVVLRLPEPAGTVPVTITGGVATVRMAAPRGTRTLVRLRGGAGAVSTPWRSANGSAAGAVLASHGWQRSRDRYAVEARAGLGSLTLR